MINIGDDILTEGQPATEDTNAENATNTYTAPSKSAVQIVLPANSAVQFLQPADGAKASTNSGQTVHLKLPRGFRSCS